MSQQLAAVYQNEINKYGKPKIVLRVHKYVRREKALNNLVQCLF